MLSPLARVGGLLFSAVAYLAFLASFLYLVLFLIDAPFAPVTVDRGGTARAVWSALAVDLGLIALFGMQHSIMARSGFKAWLKRRVTPSLERSVYVLAASACLGLLYGMWQPMPLVLWQFSAPALAVAAWVAFGFGVAMGLLSTFLIDHFDLFGLKQSWVALIGRGSEGSEFVTPWLYRLVRHPLYLGLIIAFFSTPTMTLGHLVFAAAMTAYVLIAIRFEERDLVATHGDQYVAYRELVPMLIPRVGIAGRGERVRHR
jgi:protein-S-isoprenylcysteine O-methyltransferase Ste14